MEWNNYLFYLIRCQYPEKMVFRFHCDKSTFESRGYCKKTLDFYCINS